MSEREPDIEFDFFEEEPPTQESSRPEPETRRGGRGGRRPPSAPQNLTPLLRLVGLVAFAILIIVLLVFWIKSCQAAGKEKTYKSYMSKVSEVADSSEQIGKQLSEALLAPGVKRAQLQQQISGLARREQLDVQRAQDITPPGPLRDEHSAVIQALQYRVSGLTGFAERAGGDRGDEERQPRGLAARGADAAPARERRHLGRLVPRACAGRAQAAGDHRDERPGRAAGARLELPPERRSWRRRAR